MSPAGCDHQASLTCLTLAPPDSIFNLREENKQLRKAHHDIHTQLQDAQVSSRSALPAAARAGSPSTPSALCAQVRHQDLKAAHDQLALNLQDHKSALAAAQVGPAGSWSGHSGSLTASSLCACPSSSGAGGRVQAAEGVLERSSRGGTTAAQRCPEPARVPPPPSPGARAPPGPRGVQGDAAAVFLVASAAAAARQQQPLSPSWGSRSSPSTRWKRERRRGGGSWRRRRWPKQDSRRSWRRIWSRTEGMSQKHSSRTRRCWSEAALRPSRSAVPLSSGQATQVSSPGRCLGRPLLAERSNDVVARPEDLGSFGCRSSKCSPGSL